MKLHRRSTILLAVLGFVSVYTTIYTVVAYSVSRYVLDLDGGAVWRSAPSGSFFPWPRGPGMLMILSEMNEVDLFIYTYLIKPGTLVGITILLWILWLLYLLKLLRRPQSREERRDQRKMEHEEPQKQEDKMDLQELRKRFEIPPPG